MLKIFKEKPKAGTIGCRLHFEDNTIQHDGVVFVKNPNNDKVNLTHASLGCYYIYTTTVKEVMGNTAALMMVRKKVFNSVGGYNENYTTCFEDVEFNLMIKLNGLTNYYDGSLVAYHYESKTRGKNIENSKKEFLDYSETLEPFIIKNYNKIFKK
jgi:GT2 family glycosyltransferase